MLELLPKRGVTLPIRVAEDYLPEERAALREFVEAGGGLVIAVTTFDGRRAARVVGRAAVSCIPTHTNNHQDEHHATWPTVDVAFFVAAKDAENALRGS